MPIFGSNSLFRYELVVLRALGGFSMSRCAFLAAALIVALPAGPCFAVDAKQKMATCKFGADQRRLQGEARDAFLKKCMEDRGRSARPSACRSRQRAQAIEKPAANREQRIRIKRAITCACAPVAAPSCASLGGVQ